MYLAAPGKPTINVRKRHVNTMIDPASGKIQLPSDGLEIGPELTRESFLASSIASRSCEKIRNEANRSIELPGVQYEGHPIAWSLRFNGLNLWSVSIACMDDEFGRLWSEWSEHRELARKQLHDSLLESILGNSWHGRQFRWGRVESVYDPKSGGSGITVSYTRPNTNCNPET